MRCFVEGPTGAPGSSSTVRSATPQPASRHGIQLRGPNVPHQRRVGTRGSRERRGFLREGRASRVNRLRCPRDLRDVFKVTTFRVMSAETTFSHRLL